MLTKIKIFTVAIVLLFVTHSQVFSQSDQYAGIEFGAGTSLGNVNYTSIGISYENQFSKHFGFETGIMSTNSFDAFYRYRYLEFPLSLKFYSRLLNVSAGVKSGLFTGAKLYSSGYFGWDSPYSFSLILKLSHSMEVTDAITVEPELIIIPLNTYDDISYGVGIKIKYFL